MSDQRLPVVLVSPDPDRWRELVAGLELRFRTIVASEARAIGELDLDRYAVVAEGGDATAVLALAASDAPIDAIVLVTPTDDDSLAERDSELAALDCPVLIFTGEDDPIVPVATVEALGDRLPSSTLGVLPGCGHDLVADAPETIFPMIVEYLRARYAHAPHGHDDHSGLVMLQLERRPPWVDVEVPEDDEPQVPDPTTQEVGPGA
jgi:pimeloyl-ACP methyl ester carboxylesterase